jgi:flagellar biosynthesis chaperone FliJ
MAVSRALWRLLRVLTIEEDQCRLALESAIGELRQLRRAYAATSLQARSGRHLVVTSAHTGELPDRLAGLEETRAARRRALALAPRIVEAESRVETLRQAFLAKRVECRQAETLIRETEARDAVVAGRRAQQGLDDWYLNRLHAATRAPHSLISNRSQTLLNSGGLPDATNEAPAKTLSEDLPEASPDVLNREAQSRF